MKYPHEIDVTKFCNQIKKSRREEDYRPTDALERVTKRMASIREAHIHIPENYCKDYLQTAENIRALTAVLKLIVEDLEEYSCGGCRICCD